MITDAIISAFLGVLESLLSLVPTFTLPASAQALMGEHVGSFAAGIEPFFPLNTLLACLLFTLALRLVFLSFDVTIFLWHQIHGSD